MNFITLQGRNFNLSTVEEYEIKIKEDKGIFIKGEIILHFTKKDVVLTYHHQSEFNHDRFLLLEEIY